MTLTAEPELFVAWGYLDDPEQFDIEIDVNDGGGWDNLVTDTRVGTARDYESDEEPEGANDYRARVRARNGLSPGPWSEYAPYP